MTETNIVVLIKYCLIAGVTLFVSAITSCQMTNYHIAQAGATLQAECAFLSVEAATCSLIRAAEAEVLRIEAKDG